MIRKCNADTWTEKGTQTNNMKVRMTVSNTTVPHKRQITKYHFKLFNQITRNHNIPLNTWKQSSSKILHNFFINSKVAQQIHSFKETYVFKCGIRKVIMLAQGHLIFLFVFELACWLTIRLYTHLRLVHLSLHAVAETKSKTDSLILN